MIKLKRNTAVLIKKGQEKKEMEEEISGDIGYLFGLTWELTKDAWAFYKGEDVKRRLQRNVTNIVRGRG